MDVHKSSLLDVFTAKQRLEVPLFQRQYVWSEEPQWLPLWEDIERKFTEALEGRTEAPSDGWDTRIYKQPSAPMPTCLRKTWARCSSVTKRSALDDDHC